MKALITRTRHQCGLGSCCRGKTIPPKSIAICVVFHKEKGYNTVYYHPECYVESMSSKVNEMVRTLRDKTQNRHRHGPRGRPRIYPDEETSTLVGRLRSLRYHHSQTGNEVEVEKLNKRLEEIKNACL
jgi:hypothetical protein